MIPLIDMCGTDAIGDDSAACRPAPFWWPLGLGLLIRPWLISQLNSMCEDHAPVSHQWTRLIRDAFLLLLFCVCLFCFVLRSGLCVCVWVCFLFVWARCIHPFFSSLLWQFPTHVCSNLTSLSAVSRTTLGDCRVMGKAHMDLSKSYYIIFSRNSLRIFCSFIRIFHPCDRQLLSY